MSLTSASASCHVELTYFYPWLIFFFSDTTTPAIYTLSLHDALPILKTRQCSIRTLSSYAVQVESGGLDLSADLYLGHSFGLDRKSTRLNSSHQIISYAVFCLKKKKMTPATR